MVGPWINNAQQRPNSVLACSSEFPSWFSDAAIGSDERFASESVVDHAFISGEGALHAQNNEISDIVVSVLLRCDYVST